MQKITIGGTDYDVDETGRILGAGAFCHGEDHSGHQYCGLAPEGFIEAEERGEVTRHFDDGWYWYAGDIHSSEAIGAGRGHYPVFGCCGFAWCATCGREIEETSPNSTEAESAGFIFVSASELGTQDGAWFCAEHIGARVINHPITHAKESAHNAA